MMDKLAELLHRILGWHLQIADVQVKEEKSLKVAQAEQRHLRDEVGEDKIDVERFEDLEGQEGLPTFGLQNVDDGEDYCEES